MRPSREAIPDADTVTFTTSSEIGPRGGLAYPRPFQFLHPTSNPQPITDRSRPFAQTTVNDTTVTCQVRWPINLTVRLFLIARALAHRVARYLDDEFRAEWMPMNAELGAGLRLRERSSCRGLTVARRRIFLADPRRDRGLTA